MSGIESTIEVRRPLPDETFAASAVPQGFLSALFQCRWVAELWYGGETTYHFALRKEWAANKARRYRRRIKKAEQSREVVEND